MGMMDVLLARSLSGGSGGGGGSNLAKVIAGEAEILTANDLVGATKINKYSFSYNDALKIIEIPDGVTEIGQMVCYQDTVLEEVSIGKDVTDISNNAFASCSNLAKITCYATTPPTIKSNTFSGRKGGCELYVPAEAMEAYKQAAYWSVFNNYLKPIAQ